MFGTNHSNLGEGKTTYLYSHEYYGPSKKKKTAAETGMMEGGEINSDMRKSSVSSESSQDSNDMKAMGEDQPHMVDISKLSQNEFKRLYESMRKGEPDNKVNF